ncbi:MAG: cupin domain-containing protein [Actinomycetes bacterium]
MITRYSWRRGDADPLDPDGSGTTAGAVAGLLTTDEGTVSVLHLDPGGETAPEVLQVGALLLVVAGVGRVRVGDEEVGVQVGDAVQWPARVVHALATSSGLSAVVVTHADEPDAWRVTRRDAGGNRWVAAVLRDTARARRLRDRLRRANPDEHITLD